MNLLQLLLEITVLEIRRNTGKAPVMESHTSAFLEMHQNFWNGYSVEHI